MTSTKQFVWCGNARCEQRNSSSSITAQFFSLGETIGGTSYFYDHDHLGSVREMTNSSGTVQAQYSYDSSGRVTKLSEAVPSDFQYAGYYFHAPSGLNLTLRRAYDSNLGRWLSRDPIAETAGTNLYGYVRNMPSMAIDPLGLDLSGAVQGAAVGALLGGLYGAGVGAAGGTLVAPGVGTIAGAGAMGAAGAVGGAAVGAAWGNAISNAWGSAMSAWGSGAGSGSGSGATPSSTTGQQCQNHADCMPPTDDMTTLGQCLDYCHDHCKTNHGYQNCHAACWDRFGPSR